MNYNTYRIHAKCEAEALYYSIYTAQSRKFTMRQNFKQISPILNLPSVDCASPGNPQNGLVANYTGTTNSSVAFYSCDPGLVPEGRMRAVCTRNGWSPNPADLCCAVGVYAIVCSMSVYFVYIR